VNLVAFDDAWVLWLLPLALLPLFAPAGTTLDNGWLAFAPRDRASELLGWALRTAAWSAFRVEADDVPLIFSAPRVQGPFSSVGAMAHA